MAVGYHWSYVHLRGHPGGMETGSTNMQVVVNGIASPNYTIGIN